jgi:hypothetical protein
MSSRGPRKAPVQDEKNFKFRHFDPTRMRYDCTYGAFGSRGGGKTNLARTIEMIRHLNRSIVICPSPEVHNKYRDWPRCWRYDRYDEKKIRAIMKSQFAIASEINNEHTAFMDRMEEECNRAKEQEEQQLKDEIDKDAYEHGWSDEEIVQKYERREERLKKKWQEEFDERQKMYKDRLDKYRMPYAISMIWDDIGSDKDIIQSKTLKELCNNGRHYMAMLGVLIQYCIDWPANLRSALDYLFIFKETSPKNLKRLYDYYASSFFDDYNMFVAVLNKMTERYGCMVLDMRARSLDIHDHVFFWEPECIDFKRIPVGNPQMRALADLWSVDDRDDEDDEDDHPPASSQSAQSAAANPNQELMKKVEQDMQREKQVKMLKRFEKSKLGSKTSSLLLNRNKKPETTHVKSESSSASNTTMNSAASPATSTAATSAISTTAGNPFDTLDRASLSSVFG